MTGAYACVARVPSFRHSRRLAAWAAVVIMAGAAFAVAGCTTRTAAKGGGTPACSWSLRVRGSASPPQARLIRCYLHALAHRDTSGLLAVAARIPPVRITRADLAHAADARTGLATAAFTPNPSDPTSCDVTITYADGATENIGMINMIAMGGAPVWRIDIGTDISPATGPSPARSAPSS
jgi:hypothetical protein